MRAKDTAAWMSSGALLKLSNAASTFLTARILGPYAYGQVGIARAAGEFVASFGSWRLGLSSAAQLGSFMGRDRVRASATLWLTVALASSLFAITAAAACSIVIWYPDKIGVEEVSASAAILGALLGCTFVLGAVLQNALLGLGSGRTAAKALRLQALTISPCTLLGAILFDAEGALCGALLAQISLISVSAFGVFAAVRTLDLERFDHKTAAHELPMLWHYALPGVLAAVAGSWMNWTGRDFLAVGPTGLTELGKFNAGLSWRAVITFASFALLQASLPNLSSLFASNNSSLRSVSHSTLIKALAFAFYPAAIIALAPNIFALPLGDSYEQLHIILPCQALLIFATCVSGSMAMVMTWTRRRWISSLFLMATAAGFAIAAYLRLFERTAPSVALALATCWLIHAALVAPWALRARLFSQRGQLVAVMARYLTTLVYSCAIHRSETLQIEPTLLIMISLNLWLDRSLFRSGFRALARNI